VRSAQSEIHQEFVLVGKDGTRRLGGDDGLEVEEIDDAGFDKLGLRHGSRDVQNRFIGKEYPSFRHRMHISRESEELVK